MCDCLLGGRWTSIQVDKGSIKSFLDVRFPFAMIVPGECNTYESQIYQTILINCFVESICTWRGYITTSLLILCVKDNIKITCQNPRAFEFLTNLTNTISNLWSQSSLRRTIHKRKLPQTIHTIIANNKLIRQSLERTTETSIEEFQAKRRLPALPLDDTNSKLLKGPILIIDWILTSWLHITSDKKFKQAMWDFNKFLRYLIVAGWPIPRQF